MPKTNSNRQIGLAIKERKKNKKPPMYKVLIHNDDYTPMDFVVYILKKYFQHDDASATQIMLNVHNKGVGIAGIYTKDIAETKSLAVNKESRENEHPLKTSTEKE